MNNNDANAVALGFMVSGESGMTCSDNLRDR